MATHPLIKYLAELLEQRLAGEDSIQRLERFQGDLTADGFITPAQQVTASDALIHHDELVHWFEHIDEAVLSSVRVWVDTTLEQLRRELGEKDDAQDRTAQLAAESRGFYAIIEPGDESDPDGEWAIVDAIADSALHHVIDDSPESPDEWDVLTLRCQRVALQNRRVASNDRSIWHHIQVSTQLSPNDIDAEVVLLGDTEGAAPKVGTRSIEPVDRDTARALTSWAMLTGQRRSPIGLIAGLLDLSFEGVGEIAVAAYDVGQGNCNAIVDVYEHPRLFYDFGWPPNFNAGTRPSWKPDFLSCETHCVAPVVLSHWDMDHWAYAVRSSSFDSTSISSRANWNEAALRRIWIARPPQEVAHQLGPMHMKLFEALKKTHLMPGLAAIQLWPEDTKRIRFQRGWIEACTSTDGSIGDRNNSGLAVFVVNERGHTILLPGDADFRSIPTLRRFRAPKLVGLVASHHGGRIDGAHVPRPLRGSSATLVYSVGANNCYGHPKEAAKAAYVSRKWNEHRTSTRIACEHPQTHDLGNRLLLFPNARTPRCGCDCVSNGRLCLASVPHREPSIAPASIPTAVGT